MFIVYVHKSTHDINFASTIYFPHNTNINSKIMWLLYSTGTLNKVFVKCRAVIIVSDGDKIDQIQ